MLPWRDPRSPNLGTIPCKSYLQTSVTHFSPPCEGIHKHQRRANKCLSCFMKTSVCSPFKRTGDLFKMKGTGKFSDPTLPTSTCAVNTGERTNKSDEDTKASPVSGKSSAFLWPHPRLPKLCYVTVMSFLSPRTMLVLGFRAGCCAFGLSWDQRKFLCESCKNRH